MIYVTDAVRELVYRTKRLCARGDSGTRSRGRPTSADTPIWSPGSTPDRAQGSAFVIRGISEDQAEERLGFLLKAFEYGAPPHGGIAPGFDRIVMLLAGEPNIREVMAFPKTQTAQCLMSGAPSTIDDALLRDLYLRLDVPPEE